jgi:hypothetical protein
MSWPLLRIRQPTKLKLGRKSEPFEGTAAFRCEQKKCRPTEGSKGVLNKKEAKVAKDFDVRLGLAIFRLSRRLPG